MRPIDADELYGKVEVCYKNAPTPYRKIYSDFLGLIADAPTITPPPNAPLTLEELREMDGEPVWIHSFSSVQKKTRISGWAIMETAGYANATFVRAGVNGRTTKWFANYGCTWLAYRRKPEER